MLSGLLRRFLVLTFWLKIIWIFCLLGFILNGITIVRDIQGSGVLFSLHLSFFVLYLGQVIFILIGERWVFLLSLSQALLAFCTNLDFTFVPVFRLIGEGLYRMCNGFTLEQQEVYKYVFVSLVFTLEMLKTYLLFVWVKPYHPAQSIHANPAEIIS